MSLKSLARHWDTFGRRDPHWAALTDKHRTPEEFFKTGEDELQFVLDHARTLGIELRMDHALDFGCGIGRITQAMARRFRRSDGVDVASSMIAGANEHNRYPETCRYHLNASTDLTLFENHRFTFVYSTLVLQHMKPEHAKVYIGEFLRVLAPGGLLVFQVPSHRGPDVPQAEAPRTLSTRPLPVSALRATVSAQPFDSCARAGQLLTIPVTVRNDSDTCWPSLGRPDERYQIRVANRWLRKDDSALGVEEARCPLPYDLAPGAEARVLFAVNAPQVNGEYVLELDVVQEDVTWFSEVGSPTARMPVVVVGGLSEPLPVRGRRPAQPFRIRHPRVFRTMKATGVHAVYRGLRSLVTAARHEKEVWRRRHATTMEMHCIPQAEVEAVLRDGGGALVEAERHFMDGGFQSRRYWVLGGRNVGSEARQLQPNQV